MSAPKSGRAGSSGRSRRIEVALGLLALGAAALVLAFGSHGLPVAVSLTLFLVACVAFVVVVAGVDRWLGVRWPRVAPIATGLLVTGGLLAALEAAGQLLVAATLREAPERVRDLYYAAFHGTLFGAQAGGAAVFKPHHYLNFMLNERAAYMDSGVRQFNQLGIRRKRALGKKLPGQIRVLVVGGSTTFGERIPEEERTWPYLLEVELRKALGPRTEVVNAGVPGYNVVENLLHYLLLLDGLDPDVVVLAVGLNDVHPRLVGELWPDYRNLRVPWRGNVIPEPIEALRWSRLYRYFFLRGLSFKEQHIYEVVARPWPPESTFAAQLRRNGAGIYRRHLENFVLLVQARGRKAVLVPQPFFAAESWEEHFAPAVEEHNEIGRRVASELGAVYLERSAALMTAADVFDDCHFTEAGSAKYARALAQELLAAGVFARGPVPTP